MLTSLFTYSIVFDNRRTSFEQSYKQTINTLPLIKMAGVLTLLLTLLFMNDKLQPVDPGRNFDFFPLQNLSATKLANLVKKHLV